MSFALLIPYIWMQLASLEGGTHGSTPEAEEATGGDDLAGAADAASMEV